jgi:hypothetical protein
MNNKINLESNEVDSVENNKEQKKIRLPFYKLEENKKFKNKIIQQKLKKVEWTLPAHTLYKKKKIILKKIKEEKNEGNNEEKNNNNNNNNNVNNINNNDNNNNNGSTKINSFEHFNIDEGDKMKILKHSVNQVVDKKNRLSRKQRRIQQAENTLASFLSKEDKKSLFGRKNTVSSFNFNSSPERSSKIFGSFMEKTGQSDHNLPNVNVIIFNYRIIKLRLSC